VQQGQGDAWLVLLAAQFFAHKPGTFQDVDKRIDDGSRPCHNEGSSRRQDAKYFDENRAGLVEVLQNSQQDGMVEAAALKRQSLCNIPAG